MGIVRLLTPVRYRERNSKGCAKKSRLAGGIELFAGCDVSAVVGELSILTAARLEVLFPHHDGLIGYNLGMTL